MFSIASYLKIGHIFTFMYTVIQKSELQWSQLQFYSYRSEKIPINDLGAIVSYVLKVAIFGAQIIALVKMVNI